VRHTRTTSSTAKNISQTKKRSVSPLTPSKTTSNESVSNNKKEYQKRKMTKKEKNIME
jgi:hypothetical protein